MTRIYVNIGTFLVLTVATIAWSIVNFLHLDIVERPALVTAEFEESPGLRSGYEVTYLGHAIGRIRGVQLVPGMSEVQLAIDRDAELPADVVAAARRRSAIGEPYVDLAPAPGTDPDAGRRLADGDRIELSKTSSPLQYGDLFRSLDTLVDTIDADALGTVTHELAAALDGRGDDIRRIVTGTRDLTTTFSQNGDEIEGLIDDVADLTGVLADNRDALGSGIDSLAGMTEALEEARPSVETFLDEGPSTIALMNAIIDAADHAIICTVDGTAVLDAVLDAETLRSLSGLLERSAPFADVIRLVQDPRDGIFRLFVSPSGGNPPTVEFAESKPFPDAPAVATCPERDLAVSSIDVADEAGEGAGGRRPPGDGPSRDPSGRPDTVPGELASGTSEAEPGRSLIARGAASLWPWAPLLTVATAAGWYAYVLARRRGWNA
ncbi:MCE family protein [Acidimicrobiia bacterium EGI L10123]|uniref:MlaD family protein n=1 Tax=Salinilacustrithrix flava TaxID=2957203 RepID=UPI003D7C3408|nr:MCE family protein [Acidimicrobiia bacterium EGI L10123]